jgi:hypothetical protein
MLCPGSLAQLSPLAMQSTTYYLHRAPPPSPFSFLFPPFLHFVSVTHTLSFQYFFYSQFCLSFSSSPRFFRVFFFLSRWPSCLSVHCSLSFLLLHSLACFAVLSFCFPLGICRWFDQDHSAIVLPLILLSFNSPPPVHNHHTSTTTTTYTLSTEKGRSTTRLILPFVTKGLHETQFEGSPTETALHLTFSGSFFDCSSAFI